MHQIISKLSRLLRRLKRYAKCKSQGCDFYRCTGCYLNDLYYLSEELVKRLECMPCDYCHRGFSSLDEILDVYGQSYRSLQEGRNGYCFPLDKSGKKGIFIAYPKTKITSDEDGNLTIESDGKTIESLNEAARNGRIQRTIYVPDSNGGYQSCGEFVYDAQRSKDANAEVWISIIILQHNGWQRYDKMFIIDSLTGDDDTALNLEQQVSAYKHLGKDFCQRIKVTTAKQWDFAIDKILESSNHQSVPIVHLEMHGDANGDLVVNENTVVLVSQFLDKMREVSKRCNAKVLITLAVCNGLRFYDAVSKNFAQLPCSYVIGSCQPLLSGNIEKRYRAFYRELLQDSTTKVDIHRAFAKMQDVYKDSPSDMDYYKDQKFVMITEGQVFN